jgi:hypothetical protein
MEATGFLLIRARIRSRGWNDLPGRYASHQEGRSAVSLGQRISSCFGSLGSSALYAQPDTICIPPGSEHKEAGGDGSARAVPLAKFASLVKEHCRPPRERIPEVVEAPQKALQSAAGRGGGNPATGRPPDGAAGSRKRPDAPSRERGVAMGGLCSIESGLSRLLREIQIRPDAGWRALRGVAIGYRGSKEPFSGP